MKVAPMLVAAAAVFLLAGSGCKSKDSMPAGGDLLGTTKGNVAGVSWTVPKRWAVQPERPMRVATYTIPAVDGDPEPAECAVSFFGAGQGGDVDMNVDRWKNQFENVEAFMREAKEPNGVPVTTMSLNGAYLNPAGPMMQATGRKENFRLLGAIIQAPDGGVFFKLTGPRKTVESAEKEFQAMVGSLAKK